MMWEKSREHNPQQHYFGTELLFPVNTEKVSLPEMKEGRNEQAFDEIEILGFPLCSPFDILEEKPTGDILSLEMKNYMGRMVDMIGYYVTRKYVTTVNKKLMNFGTWVDRSGHFFDTVHFPQALERSPFLGRGCYRIRGKIVEDFGFPSMEAHSMEKLPYVRDERY
jgi:DNA polymerase-3 subunit alpha